MLHSAEPRLSINHLLHWIPIFESSGFPFSILVRDENNFSKLSKKFPTLQIAYAKTPVDVEAVVTAQPELKAVFYPSNMAKNIHLLRFNHLKHVFIGTKNSDQLSKFNKSYRAYDAFWASSPYGLDRFKEELKDPRHLDLRMVGKPQIYSFAERTKEFVGCYHLAIYSDNSGIFSMLPRLLESTSLYISGYFPKISSEDINKLMDFVTEQNYKDRIKIHKEKTGIEEALNYADTWLLDQKHLNIYSLIYDIPLIVYKEKSDCRVNPYIDDEAFYSFEKYEELEAIVQTLEKEDPKREIRGKEREYLLGIEATKSNLFFKRLDEIVRS